MKSYSEVEVFSAAELELWRSARELVERIPDGKEIRCHELARAVALMLGVQAGRVQDGHYGFVEHSWIWLGHVESVLARSTRLGFPNLLDVYTPGQMPQVQLVACGNPGLPHVGWAYRPGKERSDIDSEMVFWLCEVMRGKSTARLGVDPAYLFAPLLEALKARGWDPWIEDFVGCLMMKVGGKHTLIIGRPEDPDSIPVIDDDGHQWPLVEDSRNDTWRTDPPAMVAAWVTEELGRRGRRPIVKQRSFEPVAKKECQHEFVTIVGIARCRLCNLEVP